MPVIGRKACAHFLILRLRSLQLISPVLLTCPSGNDPVAELEPCMGRKPTVPNLHLQHVSTKTMITR